jgi:hypothetical protein
MSDAFTCVITTIQEPTPSVLRLAARLEENGASLIVIGDKKGPPRFEGSGGRFVPLAEQLELPFALARLLPTGHYVRKNLGYLLALQNGARRIYETDDDNAPLAGWIPREIRANVRIVATGGWFNAYRAFTTDPNEAIWPRGFPLRHARDPFAPLLEETTQLDSPIQQELVDIAPDVDAVWRLTIANEPFRFAPDRASIQLAPGTWCPFNTQATWWFAPAFPLMYLPSTCTFRMTDIWRSFVAQRCLWELNLGVTFHGACVEQERNVHDFMRDFADEVPGYLQNERLAEILTSLSLSPGTDAVSANLLTCYEALVAEGILRDEELPMVRAWIADVESLSQ